MELFIALFLMITIFAAAVMFLICGGMDAGFGSMMSSVMLSFSLIPIAFGMLIVTNAVVNKESVIPAIFQKN